MQDDRRKSAPSPAGKAGEAASLDVEIDRAHLAAAAERPAERRPPTIPPTPQELAHTSFSFETARPQRPETPSRVSAERIRHIRTVLTGRSRTGQRESGKKNAQGQITITSGVTVLDRFVAWLVLSLKALERKLLSTPDAPKLKTPPPADLEKEKREREAAEEKVKRELEARARRISR